MYTGHQGLANLGSGSSCSSNAATFFWTSMTNCALLSWILNLSRSRVTAANCLSSSRAGSALGPRFLESVPVSSPAAYWRRHVASDEEYAPSRRISAPISPGLVHAAVASTMRRLSALVKRRRLATATTSQSMLAGKGRADTGASSVALRAPCYAPVSAQFLAACIWALGCLLIFIPTSLLSKLSGVGVAGHSGTGGPKRLPVPPFAPLILPEPTAGACGCIHTQ